VKGASGDGDLCGAGDYPDWRTGVVEVVPGGSGALGVKFDDLEGAGEIQRTGGGIIEQQYPDLSALVGSCCGRRAGQPSSSARGRQGQQNAEAGHCPEARLSGTVAMGFTGLTIGKVRGHQE